MSWTVATTPDGAAQALQARDMLAGNWLLRGWTLSDVSFYTTELPEYVLVELVRPLGTGVIHIAAAVTYTLLVLAAALLARGGARGRAGLVRGVIAAGIMLAPQLGYGAFVLLLAPDHVGTQVPLLLGWLLLDRAPRRWWVPAALALLLAWVQLADRVALLTAVLPLIVVAFAAAVRGPRVRRYELTLAGAGLASVGLAWAAARVLTAAGGFAAHPFPLTLAPLSLLWTHTWLTGWGILELYGANFLGVTGWAGLTFAAVHLIGLALAIAAIVSVLGRIGRPLRIGRLSRLSPHHDRRIAGPATQTCHPHGCGSHVVRGTWLPHPCTGWGGWASASAGPGSSAALVESVLAVAIVANVLSYLLSIEPGTVLGTGYDAREIAAVLPYGAVLAGRVFGACPVFAAGRVSGAGRAKKRDRSGSLVVVFSGLCLVLAAYGAALGYSAARPAVAGRYAVLAGWLAAHGLRYGLAGVGANVVTVDSGGRVVLAATAVRAGRVRALLYQSAAQAYDARRHDANFLVAEAPADGAGYAAATVPAAAVRATFGAPARVYRFDGYTVLVWDVNLLTQLRE